MDPRHTPDGGGVGVRVEVGTPCSIVAGFSAAALRLMPWLASSENPMDNSLPTPPDPVNRFIVDRLERGDVAAVPLYGSYARGTQHEQSDVDIIFVDDELTKSEIADEALLA